VRLFPSDGVVGPSLYCDGLGHGLVRTTQEPAAAKSLRLYRLLGPVPMSL